MFPLLVFAFFFLIEGFLFSNESKVKDFFNPNDFVLKALKNNKSLIASRTSVDAKKFHSKQSYQWRNPTFGIQYEEDLFFQNLKESNLTLNLTQNFPVPKKIFLLKKRASLEIELEKLKIQELEQDLKKNVLISYEKIRFLSSSLSILNDQLDLLSGFLKFISSKLELGESSLFAVNLIKLERYGILQEIDHLTHDKSKELVQLKYLIGKNETLNLHFPENFYSKDPLFTNPPTVPMSVIQSRPEYKRIQQSLRIAKTSKELVELEKWDHFNVRLILKQEKSKEYANLESSQFLGLGLELPIPILNNFNNKKKEIETEIKKNEILLEATVNQIQSTCFNLRTSLIHQNEKIQHYQKNVEPLLHDNINMMERAYELGEVSLKELFRSQKQLLEIRLEHLSLHHRFHKNKTLWSSASGLHF